MRVQNNLVEEEEQELKIPSFNNPWTHLGSWQSRSKDSGSLFLVFFVHCIHYVHCGFVITYPCGPTVQPLQDLNGTVPNLPKLSLSNRTV